MLRGSTNWTGWSRRRWIPRDDTGTVLWVSAAENVSLSGSDVNSVTDLVAGVSFTPGATKPVYVTSAFGNHPSIKFSSTGPSYLTNASVSVLNGLTKCTVFLLAKDATAAACYIWYLTGSLGIRCNWFSAADVPIVTDTGTATASPTGGVSLASAAILSYTVDRSLSSNECTAYLNGADVGQTRSANGDSAGSFSTASMWFGTLDGTQRPWNTGELGQLIVVNRICTATERRRFEEYLSGISGVALA